MRHYQTFQITLEAFIVHRDDLSVTMTSDPPSLPWRACVRGGRQMEWQWCATEQAALDWIESWKKPLTQLTHDYERHKQ